MEAKFDYQLNTTRLFGVMALEILKNLDDVLIIDFLSFGLCIDFRSIIFFKFKTWNFLWFPLLQVLMISFDFFSMRLYIPSISGDFPFIS